jgi:hypothetical protein
MKKPVIFLLSSIIFLLASCSNNEQETKQLDVIEQENIKLKEALKKEVLEKEVLEKENLRLKAALEQKKERFYYIKKNLKVDLDSLLVTADADIIYNVHNTENDYEIIINAIVNCSDATFYMIKIDSSGKKISTDNVGPNHIFNTADSGHASYIYNHHCFS